MRSHLAGLAALAALASSVPARAMEEPWTDNDPNTPPERLEVGDFGFTGGAEYRAQASYVNPLALNTIGERRFSALEHRLRLDGGIDYQKKIRLVASVDVLDGVLWGDNGTLGSDPESNNGTTVNARNANDVTACVEYKGGPTGDPLRADDYGWGLCPSTTLAVRRLYGEFVSPFGLFRVGRQPFTIGNSVQGATGDGRANRFGIARRGNFVDRIAFGTKPLEAFKEKDERDLSIDNGFIVTLVYDHLVSDDLAIFSDDARQVGGALIFRQPEHDLGKDFEAVAFYVQRWSDQYGSNIGILGGRVVNRFGPVYVGLEGGANIGTTREIAEAYKAITNDPVVDQQILQVGARAVARFDYPERKSGDANQPGFSIYTEVDYASGDADPQARTPLSQFVWAPDMNVGLLMFEHVFRFQTARAAAAATETLRRLGAVSYPVDSIDTRGSFTNAFAIFPQVDFRPHEDVLLRAGVLVAWAAAPVVDPVTSLLARDGVRIDDDLVNFAGGKPASFYGSELDLRAQWRFLEHLAIDLEGAILFPGDALADKNGDAVRSVLAQGRTTFFF